ncbi:SpoIIE family protein phosphatase [Blastococcus sp. SYSU D00820]
MPQDRDRAGTTAPDRQQQEGLVRVASALATSPDTHASAALPGVLADVPVAVLVIDRTDASVTYANTAAVEMAGNVRLPVPVDVWGAAAGLTDLGGEPLAASSGPLSLVAQGQPVAGEAVRLAPGRSTVHARAEADDGSQDRVLWVTGFPLAPPGTGQQLSLVVFLEVEGPADADDPEAALQALRERAVVATDIAFTITDPRQEDDPLVWVNPSFTRITGYSYEESIGRNCRFLQGPATDAAAVAELREALRERRPITITLLNHRRDGTAFWNQLSISPVFDGEGELVSFVGVQTDVTERVRVEGEREAAFAAEQIARQEAELARATAEQARSDAEGARVLAEQAQSRLALMAEATSTLIATLDMPEVLDRLAGLCVPLLADWVFLTLVDEHGSTVETAYRHRDGHEELLAAFSEAHARHLPDGSPSRQSMRSSQPVLIDRDPARIDAAFTSPAAREAFDRLGGHSALTVPMVARRRTRGAMALVLADESRSFSGDDVELAVDLCRRAALALDNVRLYQQEHAVADTLQRSLLPELPDIPGVTAAAHYVSASVAADVGGDFYDLLHLPDGAVGMVVGDVVGHDVAAAAAMGHLRGIIRACVWDAPDPDPGAVLGRIDRLVQGLRIAAMATLVYVRALPPAAAGGPWRVHVASAGHPPLLVRTPDGAVEVLDRATGLVVGVDDGARRDPVVLDLPAGSTLLAYTDGLIERPGVDLDAGIAELVGRIAGTPAGAGPQELIDAAVAAGLDGRDDVALLALRLD